MKKYIIFLFMLMYSATQATVYYVKTTGSDSSSGLSDALAWKTIAKVNAATFVPGDQILFKKGDSWYGSLTITRSGSLGNPIIYSSYGSGVNPTITGFTTVSAWTDLGSNIWESTSAVSTLSACNMVTVNGVNTAMGRYPNIDDANAGYLTYQSSTTTSITSSGLTGTPDWTNAELVVRSNYYFHYRKTITSQSSGTLNFSTQSGLTNGFGFFIQNDIRTLDQQNEWYFNPSTKKITMYSVGQPSDVRVSNIDNLIWFSNTSSPTSFVNVIGINVNGANKEGIYRWTSGLESQRAHDINIDNCSVTLCGISAISVRATNLIISKCTVSDINGTGINSGYNTHFIATDNSVNNIGLNMGMVQTDASHYYGATSGINSVNSARSTIQYNRISNVGYNGISVGSGGTNNTNVSYNYIDNYCVVSGDGGGIYWNMGASITASYNIIINGIAPIEGTNQSFRQAVGLYLDASADSSIVSHNTVYNASAYGMQMNSTNYITTSNNTIYGSGKNEVRLQRWAENPTLVQNNFNHNKFISQSSSNKVMNFISIGDDIHTFGTHDYNYYCRPLSETTTISVNQPSTGSVSYTLAQWKSFSSQDANTNLSPKTITDINDVSFYYNDSKIPKLIIVDQRSIDVTGTAYSGNVTLQPFTSLVLIKDATNTNYFVSNSGSDSNDGKSSTSPIATLPKVNSLSLVAGDNVFFKRGDSWFGQLVPQSGTAGNPITYGTYGIASVGVYCMGDSQTSGDYPPLLQTSLGSSYTVYDKGIAGNETGQMLLRYKPDITQYDNVNYVIIMGGTNDSYNNGGFPYPIAGVKANLQAMYDAAHAKGAKVIAMTITPTGGSGFSNPQIKQFILDLNVWIKTKPTNVDYVVDTYSVMDDPSNPGSLRPEDTIDGIHYTASGNTRVLDAIIASVPFQANPLNTGAKPLIHESNRMNSTSDWTNIYGNIWKNSAPTYGSELTTNLTDATNFSGITTTFTAPATGSAAVDAVDFNSGTKSFKYTCTGNAATTSQILIRPNAGFAVMKDHSYILSFYAKSSVAMNFDFNIITTDWGTTLKVNPVSITTGWTKIEILIKPTATYAAVMWVGYMGTILTAGNTINFDDFTVKEITSYSWTTDIGNIIFNFDGFAGVKKMSLGAVTAQGQFYSDPTNRQISLYSVGNPATFYTDIKTQESTIAVAISSKTYVNIDNLAIKYADYGIQGSATSYINLTNLDIGWIGGSISSGEVRKGNGIEFFAGASNNTVSNCKIWECFDAAITNQADPGVASVQTNLTYKNNQIWNCEYSYEYFNRNAGATTTNIVVENNTCYNAGGGWGHSQRPDPTGLHVRVAGTPAGTSGFVIKNNIFDSATSDIIANIFASNNLYLIDYNLIRQATGNIGYLAGTHYSTLAAYKTASGWDTNTAQTSDVKFTNKTSSDFSLQSNSPAIDAGDPSSSPDPDGTRRDIGACSIEVLIKSIQTIGLQPTVIGYNGGVLGF